ncbi:MAG: response regulator transcription factor [Chloroflexota bacterium]|nr:response regulator transcription factor [Chloroflexota bacterium]
MANEHILVVDDDKEIVRVLRAYLEQAEYRVSTAYDGQTALAILAHDHPDFLILDLMLPDKDGLDITRHLRTRPEHSRVYILMLTARVEDMDKILGLEVGADDYVTKPFNPREIVARVRAVFRRSSEQDHIHEERLQHMGLEVDVLRRIATLNNKIIELTPTEFNLLVTLMRRPGVPFSRSDLIQKRLGYDYESLERTLDSHIRNLRKKIEADPTHPVYVQTVYGVGYRLGEPR